MNSKTKKFTFKQLLVKTIPFIWGKLRVYRFRVKKERDPEQIKKRGLIFLAHPLHQQLAEQLMQQQFNPSQQQQSISSGM